MADSSIVYVKVLFCFVLFSFPLWGQCTCYHVWHLAITQLPVKPFLLSMWLTPPRRFRPCSPGIHSTQVPGTSPVVWSPPSHSPCLECGAETILTSYACHRHMGWCMICGHFYFLFQRAWLIRAIIELKFTPHGYKHEIFSTFIVTADQKWQCCPSYL